MNTKLILLTIMYLFGEGHAQCSTVYERGLTSDEINTVTSVHNNLRTKIANGQTGQPKSSNMLKLFWDDALAVQAQQLSDTCNFEHITQDDPRFGQLGQNLYMSWSTGLRPGGCNWTRAVESWFNEQSYYTYTNDDYSHYTQVVWADTYKVGCGYTYYLASDGSYQKLCACNYGPGGNVDGEFPYNTGAGCENLCQPTNPL